MIDQSINQSIYILYLDTISIYPFIEPRSDFFARCQRSVDCLHETFPHKPRQVLVLVSHAAGCVALAKALTKQTMQDITPAGPCSIYGFRRTSDTEVWELDSHDTPEGMNGYTTHLSEMGAATPPWNNFGDGTTKFYTGPATSRFAPPLKTTTNGTTTTNATNGEANGETNGLPS